MSYFKLRKRKHGIVALLLACTIMVCWIRSEFVGDHLEAKIPLRPMGIPDLISIDSLYGTVEMRLSFCRPPKTSWRTTWESYRPAAPVVHEANDAWPISIRKTTGNSFDDEQFTYTRYAALAPYYVIVLPLTVLTWWLLTSKPTIPTVSQGDLKN